MLKIGDVLRLSEDGTLTRKEISLGTGVSTGTDSNILARAVAVGVSCRSRSFRLWRRC